MVIAHIAGIPVEETLLALAPVGATGVGLWFAQLARRLRRSGGAPDAYPTGAAADRGSRPPT